MPQKPLESLGKMVRDRRGERKLREVAREIGVGLATLLRVESGRIPDVATFGKICRWLAVDPGQFLGFPEKSTGPQLLTVSAHFKADQNPKQETVSALAQMLLLAANTQHRAPEG